MGRAYAVPVRLGSITAGQGPLAGGRARHLSRRVQQRLREELQRRPETGGDCAQQGVAWAAVKRRYVKRGEIWVRR